MSVIGVTGIGRGVWLAAAAAALWLALAGPVSGAPRHALVIGVSDYGGQDDLPNAIKDARLIAGKLREAGFPEDQVRLLANPTKGQIRNALDALYLKVQSAPDALVMIYFAGHAVQSDGVNYLIPTGTGLLGRAVTPGDFDDQGFNAQLLINKFDRSRLRHLLVVLDACRDNPFGGSPGLAELTGGTEGPEWMIAFSAMAGQTASDGTGANSPYARALAAELTTPDITLTTVFERVRGRLTADREAQGQRPYAKGSLGVQLIQSPVSIRDVDTLGRVIRNPSEVSGRGQRGAARPSAVGIAGVIGVDRVRGGEDGRILLRDALAVRPLSEIRRTAEAGDADALYLLALASWDGEGGAPKDIKKAASLMRLATARGSARAASALGVYFCCDADGPKNDSEAVEWFRVGTALGSPSAMRNLGISYRDGTGVAKNLDEAVRLLAMAAEAGSLPAWANLGWIYMTDEYGRLDKEKARSYFRKGAEAGAHDSILQLAEGYRYGLQDDGKDKNPAQALSILMKGAKAGCASCWRAVAQIYEDGEGGTADPAAAYAAYVKATEGGDQESMVSAARALRAGRGTEKSLPEAYAMLEQASQRGSFEARGMLGQALARGEGVVRDPARAAALLREVLARDLSSDAKVRHAVYQPNYWGFSLDLAKLIEQGLVPPTKPTELSDLRARYGGPEGGIKRLTVPVTCGNQKVPFHIYVVDWSRPNDETSVQSQAEWLESQRGCKVPPDVIDSFTKLKRIARENNVSFTELSVYALGAAQAEAKKQ